MWIPLIIFVITWAVMFMAQIPPIDRSKNPWIMFTFLGNFVAAIFLIYLGKGLPRNAVFRISGTLLYSLLWTLWLMRVATVRRRNE